MNKDYSILLSKVVANATDTTWSQAFSIVNLYIVVSLSQENISESIASYGKEVLEKLQREFFAIDDKNLSTIKQAIINTKEMISPETSYSLILATVIDSIIYIVIASEGQVLLKRAGKVGIVAKEEHGNITAFSGKLQHNDIVIIESGDFAKKIETSLYDQIIQNQTATDIAEIFAPLIHKAQTNGTEAAIILQYHKPEQTSAIPEISPFGGGTEKIQAEQEPDREIEDEEKKSFSLPSISMPKIQIQFNKRTVIIALAITLLIVLIGGILTENLRKNGQKKIEELASIMTPAKQDYDEGVGLESLNKPLALNSLMDAHNLLTDAKEKFKGNKSDEQQISGLLIKVDNEIVKLGGNPNGQKHMVSQIFNPASSIGNVNFVVLTGTDPVAINSQNGKVAILNSDGSIKQKYDSNATSVIDATSEENMVYLLTSKGVVQLDTTNGDTRTLTTSIPSGAKAIQTFTGNLYVLDPQKQDIRKYLAGSFDSSSSYFANSTNFPSATVSFAIDGSVYVLLKNGQIKKFTRGKEDNFSISGLSKSLGANALIQTSADDTNIYVLDPENGRLVVFTKGGQFSTAYSYDSLKNASGFSVDEPDKKAYIVTASKLYSFNL